jgi:hypothetical protein
MLIATKDGMATELVGETEVERYVHEGDPVPPHWNYSDVKEIDGGALGSSVYAETPYENPRRGMLGPDQPDSSHAKIAADNEAREAAAKSAAKDRSSSRSGGK